MLRLKTILQYKIIYLILIFTVLVISIIRISIPIKSKYNPNETSITGILTEYKIDGNKFSFIIKGKEKIKGNYYIQTEKEQKYLSKLPLGITISIEGNLYTPSNNTIPNTFNYKKYLNSNKIIYAMNVNKYKVINNKTNLIYKIKNTLNKYINSFKSSYYLHTFIIGNKNYIDENVLTNYKDLGVSHIFAISGMHISILTGVILYCLKKIKVKDDISYILIISFLILYLFITNFSASVVRSVSLFILLYFNKRFDFNIETINILLLDISILLLINPYLLNNIGFIYSVTTTYALISNSHLIKGNYLVSLIKISLISFLYSLPITINNNYEINILSIFNNLIMVPIISFIIYPMCLITLIFKPLDSILLKLLKLLELISSKLLIYKISFSKMNILLIIIYYFLLYCFKNTYSKKYLIILICILILSKYYIVLDPNYHVYYLDVKQGDSIVIKKGLHAIMIDTGGIVSYKQEEWKQSKEYHLAANTIMFLKSIGIYKIDYLILTHGDYDHMGESEYLINNFKIKNIVFNLDPYNNLENNLIKDMNNIKYTNIKNFLTIGNKKLYILQSNKYNNENDNSNVVYLKINNYKFLFMGDAGVNREKDILDKYNLLDIDFIKIGHHGSNTSSSQYFINTIKPKNCLISVGKNNRYGHPKESVLDILDDYCNIYRTDINGSIEIKINKNNYKIKTYNP